MELKLLAMLIGEAARLGYAGEQGGDPERFQIAATLYYRFMIEGIDDPCLPQ